MDIPTRVGLGGTAGFTLAGLAAPLLSWWVSGPIMGGCALVMMWGFWPVLSMAPIAIIRFGKIPIRSAAIVSYERTEKKVVGDWVDRTNQTEDEKITYFIAGLKVQNVPLYGRKPPSRIALLIPRDDVRNLWLMPGTNDLADLVTKRVIYADAFVKWRDLRKHLRHLDTVSDGMNA